MPQKTAPFNIESAPDKENLTAKSGGVLLAGLFHATGCAAAADEIGVRSARGYSDGDHVLSGVLPNAPGFGTSDDLVHLRPDGGLVVLNNLLKKYQEKERRTENAFPSPPAFRQWMLDAGRTPESLAKFSDLCSIPVSCAQKMRPERKVTIDPDATMIPTERGEDVLCNYKGEKSNMAFNAHVSQWDMVIHSEYHAGNVFPRCGKSEEVHGILKNDLAGGHVPSADFGACALWWHLCVLAYNLQRLMTHALFPEERARVRRKRLLATIYPTPAKIVHHGKRIVVRVFGLPGKLIENARWKLLQLHRMNI